MRVVEDAAANFGIDAAIRPSIATIGKGCAQLEGVVSDHRSIETSDAAAVGNLVDRLSNADVRWDGTFVGLVPTIVSEPAKQLLGIRDAAPRLVNALEDDSKFVTAHVLLTFLSEVEFQSAPWNGLAIELSPDGVARVDPSQRFELARRWRAWLQCVPRPRTLP